MNTKIGLTTHNSAARDTSSRLDDVGASTGQRLGAWMGVAFTVLFVIGFVAFPSPEDDENPAAWEHWWSDSGHRIGAIVATYLMVVALGAFVLFMWSLHRRFRDSGPMLIFGSLFAAAAMVSAIVRTAIAGAKVFGGQPVPTGDYARMFDSIGAALVLVPGALAAGAFVALLSHAARTHDALPGWLTIAGYVVAALQVLAAVFFPFVLLLLWMLVASIVLVRRSRVPALSPSGIQ